MGIIESERRETASRVSANAKMTTSSSELQLKDAPGGKKYELLVNSMRRDIAEGVLRPGDRLPSLAELRTQHNLSRGTIERVHQLLEQDGLIVREQGRGTFVANISARKTQGFIGFSCSSLVDDPEKLPYWVTLQEGAREAAAVALRAMALLDYRTFQDWGNVDGLLLDGPRNDGIFRGQPDFNYDVSLGLPENLPRVSLMNSIKGVPSVLADDYGGGCLVAEHLIELGHRRIACILDPYGQLSARRFGGYHYTMSRLGSRPATNWLREYSTPHAGQPDFIRRGREIMLDWLEGEWQREGFTALFAQNDRVAAGAIEALQQCGLRVPEDVSVVGYDNVDYCDRVQPNITSVHVPLREIGNLGMQLLLRQIETGAISESINLLPVRLHLRASTGPAPT